MQSKPLILDPKNPQTSDLLKQMIKDLEQGNKETYPVPIPYNTYEFDGKGYYVYYALKYQTALAWRKLMEDSQAIVFGHFTHYFNLLEKCELVTPKNCREYALYPFEEYFVFQEFNALFAHDPSNIVMNSKVILKCKADPEDTNALLYPAFDHHGDELQKKYIYKICDDLKTLIRAKELQNPDYKQVNKEILALHYDFVKAFDYRYKKRFLGGSIQIFGKKLELTLSKNGDLKIKFDADLMKKIQSINT